MRRLMTIITAAEPMDGSSPLRAVPRKKSRREMLLAMAKKKL